MSMRYCYTCDKPIDTDFDAEHFSEHRTERKAKNKYERLFKSTKPLTLSKHERKL